MSLKKLTNTELKIKFKKMAGGIYVSVKNLQFERTRDYVLVVTLNTCAILMRTHSAGI